MRILLTGSTGMIGKRLAAKLKKKHTIIEASRRGGVDIRHPGSLLGAMKRVDIVIHAAAELDETKSEAELWETNVNGTQNLLEAAQREGISQFIFLSSVGVYGDAGKKVNEDTPPKPSTPYEKSKWEAEQRVHAYEHAFPVTIIRPALVMGPNKYWAGIFKTIRKKFPLIGKGENAWQMVHVDELVAFIALSVGNKRAYNKTFLVGENEVHTLREVVDMMAEMQGITHPGSIPKSVGMGIAHVFGIYGKITGTKPLLIPAHVKRLFKHREYALFNATKIGWKPTMRTRAALEKTFHELQAEKMI